MEEPSAVEASANALNRRSGRVRVSIPVTLIWHEAMQRQHEQAQTVSVSRFGCLLRTKNSFPLGSTIRIEHGYKFMLGHGAWLMIRLSGTEPVVRIYAEAKDKKTLDEIVEEGRRVAEG